MLSTGGSFRRTRALICASLGLAVLAAAPAAQARSTLYVSGSASEDVVAFEVGADGSLTPTGNAPAAAGEGASGVALGPDGARLYVANAAGESISAFQVTPTTGALSPLPGSPFDAGRGPLDLAATPDGRYLYVGNLLANRVSGFGVGPSDGALSPLDGSPFRTGRAPAGVAVSPDGKLLYVANGVSQDISAFAVNRRSGALSPLDGSPFAASGAPLDLALSPDGRHLYASGIASGISGFDVDAGTGALRPLAGSPFASEEDTQAIAVSPDGRNLYASESPSGDVLGFEVDPATGTLSPVEGSPFEAGDGPAGLAIAPGGRHLYASASRSSEVHAFDVDPDSGAIAPVSGSPYAAGVRSPGVESLAISPNQTPVAAFEIAPAAPQEATSFDAGASHDPDGDIVRYDWDFGDGGTLPDGGPTPTYVYRSFDTYTVTLTVTDEGGCSTVLVSTGETVHCNGGAQASASRPIELEQPGLRLRGKRVQRAGRSVVVTALCSERCTVTARGTLIVKLPAGRASRSKQRSVTRRAYSLREASASAEPGRATRLRLRLSPAAHRATSRALRRGGKVKANVSAGAADELGITSRPKGRRVKLSR